MRHQPLAVDAVAREAAAEVVVHPAERHRAQRLQRHRARARLAGVRDRRGVVVEQQELEAGGVRELRRGAEAAPRGVEGAAHALDGAPGQLRRDRAVTRRFARGGGLELLRDAGGRGEQALAVGVPRVAQRLKQAAEAGPAVAVLGREVGAGEERVTVGRHEHGHRPAALAGHRLRCRHVDAVDVGALLAVDLDADVALVHEPGDARVLERLVRHDVAPVARAVADGEQDRAVLGARALERLVAPRVPVHGVRGMLQQVGAGLVGEAVAVRRLLVAHGVLPSVRGHAAQRVALARGLTASS